jgi:hypothetical protein
VALLRTEEVIPYPDGTSRVFDILKASLFHSNGGRKDLVILIECWPSATELHGPSPLRRTTMWNVICPHCGKPAFKWIFKVILGPARTAGCRSCRTELSVSWKPLMAGVFLFVGFVLVGSLPNTPFLNTSVAVTVFVALVLGWAVWFIRSPLVKGEEPK